MPPAAKQYTIEVTGPNGQAVRHAVQGAIYEGLKELRNEVEMTWNRYAQMAFDTSAKEYMAGVSVKVNSQADGIQIDIQGWLPVALETGAPRFDMKPGLLKGRDFRVIPMHDGEFRTVSKTSPKDSWWHPGFQGRRIHEQIEWESSDMLERAFGPAFDRIKV